MAEEEKKEEGQPAASEAENPEEVLEQEKKKAKKQFMILAAVVGLLFLLLVGALVLMFTPAGDKLLGRQDAKKMIEMLKKQQKMKKKKEGSDGMEMGEGMEEAEAASKSKAKAKKQKKEIIYVKVPSLIVNLNSPTKRGRFIKATLYVEVDKEEEKAAIEKLLPRIIDQFQTYMRNLDPDDIAGNEGLERLRMELLKRVNGIIRPVVAEDILFQEFIIQ